MLLRTRSSSSPHRYVLQLVWQLPLQPQRTVCICRNDQSSCGSLHISPASDTSIQASCSTYVPLECVNIHPLAPPSTPCL